MKYKLEFGKKNRSIRLFKMFPIFLMVCLVSFQGSVFASLDESEQRLSYNPKFKGYYLDRLKSFQRFDLENRRRGLYDFTEHAEKSERLASGKIKVTPLGIKVVKTLGVRERRDLDGVYRYNVSGHQFNCLFHCFSLVNPKFRRGRGTFISRRRYIDFTHLTQ